MVTAGQGGVQSQILEVMRMLLECETTERVYIPQRLIDFVSNMPNDFYFKIRACIFTYNLH